MKTETTRLVDCYHENCPMPLVITREAILEAEAGDVITVVGDHPQSFEEIPMALEIQEMEILEKKMEGREWRITFVVS
jgi:TusA-related sulfurtransferase